MTLQPVADTIDFVSESIKRSSDLVTRERVRQDQIWGEQNHPDGTGPQFKSLADEAREDCDQAARKGDLTWMHILREEFCEALAEEDEEELKKELIQVAAVACGWVESIERRQQRRLELCRPTNP